jgi:hypothetical protein
MVLTAAQTAQFFESNDQMGHPNATVVQLQNEGILIVDDLNNFDKDNLQQVADNQRQPGERVQTQHLEQWRDQQSQLHRLFLGLSLKSDSWQHTT